MAAGPLTQITDIIVPQVFTQYVQQVTEEKTRLIQSGAVVRDPVADTLLAGGGKTFNLPSFRDLDSDVERVSTDTPYINYTGGVASPDPRKIQTSQEVAVRLSRNQSWSTADLTVALAGADPALAIASQLGGYWSRRLQQAFIASIQGVFADNAAAPSGTEHVQGDLTLDISGVSFVDGVTNFSGEAFIDATTTIGDSEDSLGLLMVHSVVYGRMQKNNLIDFIPDARGETVIPTFLGRQVIRDDSMPRTGGVYESWLFGQGAIRLGVGSPFVPTETSRLPDAGNGGGQSVLFNRVEWCIHPVGHAYVGTAPNGGPTNAATSNNLANAGSWQRVFPERKQIKLARLITREA